MQLHMIYGKSIPFDDLVNYLKRLNEEIRKYNSHEGVGGGGGNNLCIDFGTNAGLFRY